MRKMKDSGIEWIGEIPESWENKPIKALFSFGKGLPITKDNLIEDGLSVISYGQIHSKNNIGTEIKNELIRYVDKIYYETNPQSLVHEGDFIFADTSEDLEGCGNFVYVNREEVLFAGYHTIVLFSKEKRNNKYLGYLFQTDCWRSQIRCCCSGVKLFSISRKILGATSLILPPLSEQQRITDFLDKKCAEIDTVIAKTKATIEEYKKLKQSIITEAVTKGLNPNAKMKDSGIEWIGEIPEDWEVKKLKPFLKWKSIKGCGKEVVLSLYRDYGVLPKDSRDDNHNVTSLDTDSYKLVDIGDFVINKMKAWQGSMAVSNFRGIVSPAYHVCSFTSSKIYKPYFHYLMRNKSYLPEYERLSSGLRIGQWDLSFEDFCQLPFLLPPLSEQQQIADYLDQKCSEIDALITKKEQLVVELESYKKSLIYEVVTGKREV